METITSSFEDFFSFGICFIIYPTEKSCPRLFFARTSLFAFSSIIPLLKFGRRFFRMRMRRFGGFIVSGYYFPRENAKTAEDFYLYTVERRSYGLVTFLKIERDWQTSSTSTVFSDLPLQERCEEIDIEYIRAIFLSNYAQWFNSVTKQAPWCSPLPCHKLSNGLKP